MRNPWLILFAGVVGTLASLPGQTNGFSSLVATGFTFHVVGIFLTAGMPRATALAVFFPATTIAVALPAAGVS